MSRPKEAAYDEHIAPLMKQVIALCKEHSINAFATFTLDLDEDAGETLQCTTALPVDEGDEIGSKLVGRLRRETVRRPSALAVTVTSGGAR